jgi:hypothetical protein
LFFGGFVLFGYTLLAFGGHLYWRLAYFVLATSLMFGGLGSLIWWGVLCDRCNGWSKNCADVQEQAQEFAKAQDNTLLFYGFKHQLGGLIAAFVRLHQKNRHIVGIPNRLYSVGPIQNESVFRFPRFAENVIVGDFPIDVYRPTWASGSELRERFRQIGNESAMFKTRPNCRYRGMLHSGGFWERFGRWMCVYRDADPLTNLACRCFPKVFNSQLPFKLPCVLSPKNAFGHANVGSQLPLRAIFRLAQGGAKNDCLKDQCQNLESPDGHQPLCVSREFPLGFAILSEFCCVGTSLFGAYLAGYRRNYKLGGALILLAIVGFLSLETTILFSDPVFWRALGAETDPCEQYNERHDPTPLIGGIHLQDYTLANGMVVAHD